MSILDVLFPKRCLGCRQFGSYVCASCFANITFLDAMVCAVCQRQAMGGVTHPVCRRAYTIDGVFSSLIYKGIVKKLVYSFKYPPYLTDLQGILADLFYEGIIQKEQFVRLLQLPFVFVPIPLHDARYRARGYNQSTLLATQLAKRFGGEVTECLQRIHRTNTQVGLSKEQRAKNVKGAFALLPNFNCNVFAGKQIFLVDDVATSGATLREAAKVLKKNGTQYVWGITLAHGE